MRAQFALFGFKMQRIDLEICLITLGKIVIMFNFVQSIALYTSRALEVTSKGGVFPLPTIFVLWDIWIHICISNSGNITTNIEAPINKHFDQRTTLSILYVNLYDSYVQFRRNFDNIGLWCNFDVVENISGFNDQFYNFRIDRGIGVFNEIMNTQDLQVQFGKDKHSICH